MFFGAQRETGINAFPTANRLPPSARGLAVQGRDASAYASALSPTVATPSRPYLISGFLSPLELGISPATREWWCS
jgi:hypothetical protein